MSRKAKEGHKKLISVKTAKIISKQQTQSYKYPTDKWGEKMGAKGGPCYTDICRKMISLIIALHCINRISTE